MKTVASTFSIYALSLGCLVCGAMMSDIVSSLMIHRFRSFYAAHTAQFWLTIPVNAAVIFLLIWRVRQVVRSRRDPTLPQETAGVGPSLIGLRFRTTAFVRVCVYAGFYILGICLAFA